MRCAHCAAENREGRRFCADCGKPLPEACAQCGFANAPGERFCGGCGRALGDAPAVASPPSDDGERRPITVLFADLTGFTRLSQALDPEDVHRVLERYFDAVDAVVESCGGRIDKHIGDGVMAVFGAPVAHGDDAVRAVSAAVDIHRAVQALDVVGRDAMPLAAHIGIAAGEVMASGVGSARHRSYTVIGKSVNLAARLLQEAQAGETLIDDAVHRATAHVARCEAVDALTLKGIDEPVHAWRLLTVERGVASTHDQPLVGRHAELAQLEALLQSCRQARCGGAVLLRGEAGMGKSRLAQEIRARAMAAGFAAHTVLVLDFGTGKGRDAMASLAMSLLSLSVDADAETRNQALAGAQPAQASPAARAALADLIDASQDGAGRALLEGMEHGARQRARSAALAGVLRTACAHAPLLLAVEDVHWADASTLDHVAALTRAVAELPAMLVLTTRIEGDRLDVSWRASLDGAPLATIDLGPLSHDAASQLAGRLYATSQRFTERCIARAGGNPLFLEQLLRAADEHEEALPASLQSLVLARLDRLPERDRTALRVASVIGQRFSLADVRALARLEDYDAGALLAHAMVRPEGGELLFTHALIRDGVYASLTRARRSELHRAAAALYRDRDAILHAEHLDRAGAEEAPRAYLGAAAQLAGELKLDQALALAQRGAALAVLSEDKVELAMLEGGLLRETGSGAPAVMAYTRALADAAAPAVRCRALLGIAFGRRLTGDVAQALTALAEAEPIARDPALVAERAELHVTRGNLHFAQGRIVDCRREHAAALAIARDMDSVEWQARALSGLADADYLELRMRTAFGNFRRCVELCEAHGLTRIAIPNRIMVGHARSYLTEFDAGLSDMQAAREAARAVGNRHAEMFATQSCGLLLTACGRYPEAEPYLLESRAMAEGLGARRYLAGILGHHAEALLAAGRRDEAIECLDTGLSLARETGMKFSGPMLLALLMRASNDPRQRDAYRAEVNAVLDRGCVGHSYIAYYRLSIDDAIAARDWAQGLELVHRLAEHTRPEPLPYTELLIERGRALIALGQQPGDEAMRARCVSVRARADAVDWRLSWPQMS
jgi:class 3 adenylate cyclase/tetratricopeptide (TPR) repeat protein